MGSTQMVIDTQEEPVPGGGREGGCVVIVNKEFRKASLKGDNGAKSGWQ